MPRIQNTPEALRVYLFHGVDLSWSEGAENAVGECPFCGGAGKFSVNTKTGLWRCFVCAEGSDRTVSGGGNATVFLRCLWAARDKATNDYSAIAKNRGLLEPETAMHWGICQDGPHGDWLVPGYAPDGKLMQLYRYQRPAGGGKATLLASPTFGHQLHGVPLVSAANL